MIFMGVLVEAMECNWRDYFWIVGGGRYFIGLSFSRLSFGGYIRSGTVQSCTCLA